MPTITAQWLRDRKACATQVSLFEREFPDGGKLILHEIQRASDAGLFLPWIAAHVLTADGQALFAERTQATRSALEDIHRSAKVKHAEALAADRAMASQVIAAERAPYERAYKQACAEALFEAGRRYGWVV